MNEEDLVAMGFDKDRIQRGESCICLACARVAWLSLWAAMGVMV
jgi:hypothetical protein